MSGAVQLIEVFSQHARFNVAVIPAFNLARISFQPS